jgi:hypothetical protein
LIILPSFSSFLAKFYSAFVSFGTLEVTMKVEGERLDEVMMGRDVVMVF